MAATVASKTHNRQAETTGAPLPARYSKPPAASASIRIPTPWAKAAKRSTSCSTKQDC